ncbi:hypothetical protein LTR04_005484 [Oleoguttula sp. CCFEE 6159]|nr:hypothetical protein LTR04_005484 [Oleoguttula sp. CCFEE 6159]
MYLDLIYGPQYEYAGWAPASIKGLESHISDQKIFDNFYIDDNGLKTVGYNGWIAISTTLVSLKMRYIRVVVAIPFMAVFATSSLSALRDVLAPTPIKATSAPVKTPPEFILKAELTAPNSDPSKARFNDLYLGVRHTGAGTNVAVLTATAGSAIKGILNGTHLAFSGLSQPAIAFGLYRHPHDLSYAAWGTVTVDAGKGDSGYSFNGTTLQADFSTETYEKPGFGWLVCSWWYGMPELFYLTGAWFDHFGAPARLPPCNCATVDLVVEYV